MRLWLSFALAAIWSLLGWAFTITSLEIGSTIDGTTVGNSVAINLANHQAGPQAIYGFTVHSTNDAFRAKADVKFSTCISSSEESKGYNLQGSALFVISGSAAAAAGNVEVKALAESAPDCDGKYATIDFRAQTGVQYMLIVTSTQGRSGSFRLATQTLASPPTPTPLPWGLDRIDQRMLPLDKKYSVRGLSGTKTYVYVLDSGVRTSHAEFISSSGERNAIHGVDVVERLDYASDCTGHGTHVAAIIAGQSFGVAKNAQVISVRVVGCDGGGHTSRLMEGLEFVMSDSEEKKRRPALVCMSLSAPKSDLINDAVSQLSKAGIPVITAAGNSDEDSCNYSPASEPSSITVAASGKDDSRPTYSNSGACMDLFAPGEEILSAWNTGDHAHKVQSGTSFACPHVAGAVAVLLSVNPELPADAVASMLNSAATFATVTNHSSATMQSRIGSEATDFNNRLLYVRPIPSLSLEAPTTGKMYLYAVLRVTTAASQCSEQWLLSEGRSASVSKQLSNLASSDSTDILSVQSWMCCPTGSDETQCGKATDDSRLFIRIQEREALAAAKFETLQSGLRNIARLRNLATSLKVSNVTVAVEPWVVDSDSNVFWAAPDLRASTRGPLSAGVIAAIAVCGAALLIGSLIALCLCRRGRRERREALAHESAVADHNAQRQLQEPLHPLSLEDCNSPRGYIARENTALQGDVLRNLPSTASLVTPRNPLSTRAMNASRSVFSGLKNPFADGTPRRARKNGGEAAFGGGIAAGPSFFGGSGDGLLAGPSLFGGGAMSKGSSFMGRQTACDLGGRSDAHSPGRAQQTEQERADVRRALEAARPFRPVDSFGPGTLLGSGSSNDDSERYDDFEHSADSEPNEKN